MVFQNVFNQILILFLIILIGIVAKKFKAVSDRFSKDLTGFILNISLPAMLIDAMNFDFSPEKLKNGGILLLLGTVCLLASVVLAVLATKLLNITGPRKNIYQYMLIFSNVGFMGIPVTQAIYGSDGVFYTALYNIPFAVLTWTVGLIVIDSSNKGRISARNLCNPGLISVVVGFVMFIFSIKLPKPAAEAIKLVGGLTTPLSMLLIGFILADSSIKDTFASPMIYLMSFIRLLAIPLIFLMALKPFVKDSTLLGVLVIMSAMPAAANTAIFASRYDGDAKTASECIFVSTLLSIVTIPLVTYLINAI